MLSEFIKTQLIKKEGIKDYMLKYFNDDDVIPFINNEINLDTLILNTLFKTLNEDLNESIEKNKIYEKLMNVSLN